MFPDFPNFAPLRLEDRDKYNQLVKDWPAFADISFTNLHIWWNLGGKLGVCLLNANLVLNYDLPFDQPNCGWGLVGKSQIDKSAQTIFKYLKARDRQPRIVHMPEFTVEQIKNKDLFKITEESDFHEYIMSAQQLAMLEGPDHSRTRRKVKRFLRETQDSQVDVKSLDLTAAETRKLITESIQAWHEKYANPNDPDRLEEKALENTLNHTPVLGTLNLCVFIDGQLHGLTLFHPTPDGQHYIINHLKVDYRYAHIFDYVTQQLAIFAQGRQVPYLNMEMDLGMEGLRQHKLGLRPVEFYKKFTVEPKN
jgi:hypothetical protein